MGAGVGDERDLLAQLRGAFAGEYAIEQELGGGGMSRLFLAADRALNRKVVLKILPPDLTSEVMAARFKREFEVTAHLQHPHILPIIGAGERDGLLYYIMPFVAGEALRNRLEREGQIPIADSVRILAEVADALAYAHEQGVVHRDIKPENILLQGEHAVLADFGIAAALQGTTGDRLTRTGMSLGTIGYMAPEQALGESNVDGRADIYSLGVVGYEMLAGQPPFIGTSTQQILLAHLTEDVPRLDRLCKDAPKPLCQAIETALRKEPAERFQTAREFRDALTGAGEGGGRSTRSTRSLLTRGATRQRTRSLAATPAARRRRRRWWWLAAPLVAVLAGGAALYTRFRGSAPSGIVTIAVAPFNVLDNDPDLQLWKEGFVDVMARNLDGAGPVRVVPPVVAIRELKGVANRSTAADLARRTGARYAIFGRLLRTGTGESVRLFAQLVDQQTDSVRDLTDRTDTSVTRLADLLALDVLGALSKQYRLGAARGGSIGAASPFALKAFLRGEQYYRRTAWDSALTAYQRATTIDTGFALALRRISRITSWQRSEDDSVTRAFAIRAGRANHRLAPRDSLLILADSLRAALATSSLEPPYWSLVRRLFATLETAARRYPSDPEVWYTLGEARFHYGYGSVTHTTEASTLDAFERSIRFDSLFAPAYIHAVELGFTLAGRETGRRYAQRYLALDPGGQDADAIRLIVRLTDPAQAGGPETKRLLDTAATDVLHNAFIFLRRWPDSSETALLILRAVDGRPRAGAPRYVRDSTWLRFNIPTELAFRGRVREATLELGGRAARTTVELALLDTAARDSVGLLFRQWLQAGDPRARYVLPWWVMLRDTASIQRLLSRADAQMKTAPPAKQGGARYDAGAARAYLALARGDTAAALSTFAQLSDTLCLVCYFDRLAAARAIAAWGKWPKADSLRWRQVDSLTSERLYVLVSPADILMAWERGRAAERLGRRDEAVHAFTLVSEAWARADPQLRPYVTEARAALTRLRAAGTPVAATPSPGGASRAR